MKFAMKSIVAAAAFVAAGVASAAVVTVPVGDTYNNLNFTGSGSLAFSAELLGALDTGKVSVAAFAPATADVQKDADGFYTKAVATAPITALRIDGNQVVGAETKGGATQTAIALKSVSSGGSLTVTDINVDLVNKKVFATIIGGNGVGTLTNFYLWDIRGKAQYDADLNFLGYDASTAIVGPTTIAGRGTYVTELNGLQITTDGFNKLSQSLGLLSLGKSALQGVHDFGTITSTINAIPEPSTYALMGLGLVGMSLVARRRAK